MHIPINIYTGWANENFPLQCFEYEAKYRNLVETETKRTSPEIYTVMSNDAI